MRNAKLSAFVAIVTLCLACTSTPRAPAVWVEIPTDASVRAVAESLAAHGIVKHAPDFERLAMRGHRYREIRPGVYALRPSMSMGHVLSLLRRGGSAMAKVVIRERMTLAEAATAVEQALRFPADSFIVAAQDSSLRERMGARAGSVEGYLYPTMYYVVRDASPEMVVRQMVDTFQARWRPQWTARLNSLGVTRDEIVTLASIIAGEMPHPEDLFQVSSVYHNRLARGMRLQADPTVVYALGERRRLNFKDYRVESEYNTYTFRGLPPGPIGQPSVTSLEAALYPGESEDLFFVGRNDGRHEFSRTYREHLQTIAQLRSPKKKPPVKAPVKAPVTAVVKRPVAAVTPRDTAASRSVQKPIPPK